MRYTPDHKAKTRHRVLSQAAAAIRAHGPENVSVATMMRRAGLTHGGFYAHFESKDALIAEAVAMMFDEVMDGMRASPAGGRAGLEWFIETYLSERHLGDVEKGCPIAALATNVPRMEESAQRSFRAGVDAVIATLSAMLAEIDVADADVKARAMVAEMSGTLSFARAAGDRDQALRTLAASRTAMLARIDQRLAA